MRIEEITTTKPPPTDEHIPAWPLRGTLVTGGKGKDVANGSGLIRATDPTGEVYAGRGSGERVQDGGMAGTREHQQTKLDQPRGGGVWESDLRRGRVSMVSKGSRCPRHPDQTTPSWGWAKNSLGTQQGAPPRMHQTLRKRQVLGHACLGRCPQGGVGHALKFGRSMASGGIWMEPPKIKRFATEWLWTTQLWIWAPMQIQRCVV